MRDPKSDRAPIEANVTLVSGFTEREGLYVGDRLAEECSQLSAGLVLHKLLGVTVVAVDEFDVDQDWLDDRGCLPNSLAEIPAEVRSGASRTEWKR